MQLGLHYKVWFYRINLDSSQKFVTNYKRYVIYLLYSRSFSMMVKWANYGLLQAYDGKMLGNDGEMLANDQKNHWLAFHHH